MSDRMETWRSLADAHRWDEIDYLTLSLDEREEVEAKLSYIVPKILRGCGLETYWDYADDTEVLDKSQAAAARLLAQVSATRFRPLNAFPSNWLEIGRARAAASLQQFGIEVEGEGGEWRDLSDIFGYFCSKTRTFVEVSKPIAEALWRKEVSLESAAFEAMGQDDYSKLEAFRRWMRMYPWRGCRSLRYYGRDSRGWENSELEHALALYSLADLCATLVEHEGVDYHGMGFAFECGHRFASLFWKQHENAIIRHHKNTEQRREAGRKGGQAEKKRERHAVLNALAAKNLKRFQFVSDSQALRAARRLAAEYDAGSDVPLFLQNNKPLSASWFSDWLSEFRLKMSRSS